MTYSSRFDNAAADEAASSGLHGDASSCTDAREGDGEIAGRK